MSTKKKVIQGGVDVQTSAGASALTVDETTGVVTAGTIGLESTYNFNTGHLVFGPQKFVLPNISSINNPTFSTTASHFSIGFNRSNGNGEVCFIKGDGVTTGAFSWHVATSSSATTEIGSATDAGAWTLGTNGGSAVQQLNGEVLIKQGATSGSVRGLTYYDGSSNTCGFVQIDATANTVTYTNTSDARLKTNHRDFDGLSLVSQMKPSKYQRICNLGVDEIGLVAQELQPVMPEAVVAGGEDATRTPWGVDYGRITPVLVKAIQEQQAMIEELKAEVALLKAK